MNILSITHLPDGCYQTDMVLQGGVKVMEIHRKGLHDSKVLTEILSRNYYQNLPGSWRIHFVDDPHTISESKLVDAIDKAQMYIFSHDNSDYGYGGIC